MTSRHHKKKPETLRSARWLAPDDLRAFGYRSRAMQMGYAPEEWKDRGIFGLYPATDEQTLKDFAAWRKARGR